MENSCASSCGISLRSTWSAVCKCNPKILEGGNVLVGFAAHVLSQGTPVNQVVSTVVSTHTVSRNRLSCPGLRIHDTFLFFFLLQNLHDLLHSHHRHHGNLFCEIAFIIRPIRHTRDNVRPVNKEKSRDHLSLIHFPCYTKNTRKSLQKSNFTIGVWLPLDFAAGFTRSTRFASGKLGRGRYRWLFTSRTEQIEHERV
ncbi:hypothetical protein LXL04_024478, partial [Taraxacum kok-saghyz]